MKRILLLFFLILTGTFSCDKENQKYFNPESLVDLNLHIIDGFWPIGVDIDTMRPFDGGPWIPDPGFIKGRELFSLYRGISVLVFESQSFAIEAIESKNYYDHPFECTISDGSSEIIKDIWRYTDCSPNKLWVNKLNTIIEVTLYNDEFEAVADTMYNAAKEIASRIMTQSD